MCDKCNEYASNKEFQFCPICGNRIIHVIGVSEEEFYKRVVDDANIVLEEYGNVSWDKVFYGVAHKFESQDEASNFYKDFENYSWHHDFDPVSYINRAFVIENVLFDAYYNEDLKALSFITVRPKDFTTDVFVFLA